MYSLNSTSLSFIFKKILAFLVFILSCDFIVNFRVSGELNAQRPSRDEAESIMEQLMTLVQFTAVSVFLVSLKKMLSVARGLIVTSEAENI